MASTISQVPIIDGASASATDRPAAISADAANGFSIRAMGVMRVSDRLILVWPSRLLLRKQAQAIRTKTIIVLVVGHRQAGRFVPAPATIAPSGAAVEWRAAARAGEPSH